MKKLGLLVIFLLTLPKVQSYGQKSSTPNDRVVTSLDGYWKYIVDPYENGFYDYRYRPFENQPNPPAGAFFTNTKRKSKSDLIEYDFDKMDSLMVPGDWNTQKENLFYYEGTVWYKKSFDYSKKDSSNRLFLEIGAANYKADVYLNGRKLGQHLGGFTPFGYEVTDMVQTADNFLIIKVDNTRNQEGVPTLNTDWWNYGGITRGVRLVEKPSTYIKNHRLSVTADKPEVIQGEVHLDGEASAASAVKISLPELQIDTTIFTDQAGRCSFVLSEAAIEHWSPEQPKLYDVQISTNLDKVTDLIGFRTLQTVGPDILLNGSSIFLKGISIHEESPLSGGRCHGRADARQLLTWAKELGCNYVRLAHYPHNEHMVQLADSMGVMVWEEIPVYWTIDWSNEQTYENAENQLAEVIARDVNRASVIIWSMANETPTSDERNQFLGRLAEYTKQADPTRLISAALEQQDYQGDSSTRTISDPFAEVVDILSFNQYIGWYDGGIEKCRRISWEVTQDKPVIISEFGAGAKYGLHGDRDERWTEEYQEYLYEETLLMIDKIAQLRGVSPWILVDFRSPRRILAEVQDNYNRKGLISEKGEKKKAFYALQKYYQSK